MKKYLVLSLFLLPLFALCQIGGSSGIGSSTSSVSEDFERACYSNGVDTLSGWVSFEGKEKRIYDLDGNIVDFAIEVDENFCKTTPDCKKSKNLYSLVDNTGTNFANENTLRVYFTDGTSFDIVQPPQSNPQGWTKQLQSWDDLITELLASKCSAYTVETRFNPPPFTSTDLSTYTPPDGLLVPSSELWGLISSMKHRYLNITICATCPAINQMDLVAINGVEQAPVIPMTFQFEEGLETRYDWCQSCGQEGTLFYENSSNEVPESDYPVCLFSCNEDFPPIPESGCNFTIRDDLCDLGVVDIFGNFKPITVRYTDCGDGETITDVFEVDPVDATLVNYVPIGNIGDCVTGTVVDPPEPIVVLDEIEKLEICDGGKTLWQVNSIKSDGTLVVTYEDGLGEVLAPDEFYIGACIDTLAISFVTLCDSLGNEYEKCKLSDGTTVITDSEGNELSDSGNSWTLLTKLANPHPESVNYTGIVFIGNLLNSSTGNSTFPLGQGPMSGQPINGWNVFSVCSETQPIDDSNGGYWIQGPASSFASTLTYNGTPNADLSDCGGSVDLKLSYCNVDFETEIVKACFKGVSISVTIAYDINHNVLWYADESGNEILNPDFNSSCPERICTIESISICADGDYADIGVSDGDAILASFENCNDGTRTLLGGALFSDLTANLDLPEDFAYNSCAGPDLAYEGCFIDADDVQWSLFTVNGTDQAYQNNETKEFGTPVGSLTPCPVIFTPIDALDDKHCINVEGNETRAFLILNEDLTISAKAIPSGTVYNEGEYALVSCCSDGGEVRSLYYNGFTALRPTDTPNTGWNNQLINNPPALNGDFKLCFTVDNWSGNSPNMIGINSDPNSSANFQSIDCAEYIRPLNGTTNTYQYQNGSYAGQLSTLNYTGQEFCFERVGSLLTYTIAGNAVGTCPISTGAVFLDDSHYYAAGTWGTGTITYSDFELVTGDPEEVIKSVSECDKCCNINIID